MRAQPLACYTDPPAPLSWVIHDTRYGVRNDYAPGAETHAMNVMPEPALLFRELFFSLSFSDEQHAHPGPSSFFLFGALESCKATRYVVEKKSLDWFLAFIDLPSRTRKRRTAVRALAFSYGHNLLLTKLLPCCVVWHHPHPTNPTHIGNLFLGNGTFFSFDILRVSLRPRALLEEGPTHGWSWAQGHFW